jgi:hypothetical protein
LKGSHRDLTTATARGAQLSAEVSTDRQYAFPKIATSLAGFPQ